MLLRKSLWIGGLLAAAFVLISQGCNKSGANPGATTGEAAGEAARSAEIVQPMKFDHAVHIKAEDMDCLDCHKFAAKGRYATLPRIKDCTDCHSEPQGKDPEEPKVRDYTENDKEIAWITVNKLAGHVYFSHRAHVDYGEMKCSECHVDMTKVSKSVVKPDIGYLSMSKCMACHKERQVENDCASCHK